MSGHASFGRSSLPPPSGGWPSGVILILQPRGQQTEVACARWTAAIDRNRTVPADPIHLFDPVCFASDLGKGAKPARPPRTSTPTLPPREARRPSPPVRSGPPPGRGRMLRRRLFAFVALTALLAMATPAAHGSPATSSGQLPTLSTTDRLADRREVAAGTRAHSIGFEDGRFYANGWHITGEMGGVWAPPLKLVDGVWFGLDGQWVGPATKFSSGWGYTSFALPDTAGLKLERTDFVPDGRRGALFGLEITNPGPTRTAKLSVDAHSELMGQYPWGFGGVTPNASDNLPDKGSYDGQNLRFTDDGALPGAPEHHYAALVGTALKPDSGTIGDQFWGPQPGHRCTGTEPGAPADPKPSQCDDGPFGRGTGGELTYTLSLPAGGSTTVWLAVAGSDRGLSPARAELD